MEKTQSIFGLNLVTWRYLLMGLAPIGLMVRLWFHPIPRESASYFNFHFMSELPPYLIENSNILLSVVITTVIALIASACKFQHPLLLKAGKFILLVIVIFPSVFLLVSYMLDPSGLKPVVDLNKGSDSGPSISVRRKTRLRVYRIRRRASTKTTRRKAERFPKLQFPGIKIL